MKYYINQSGNMAVRDCGQLRVIDADSCETFQLSFEQFCDIHHGLNTFEECSQSRYLAIRDKFIKSIL